jgi:hypothetical protein
VETITEERNKASKMNTLLSFQKEVTMALPVMY